jgi:hypothetical protein
MGSRLVIGLDYGCTFTGKFWVPIFDNLDSD